MSSEINVDQKFHKTNSHCINKCFSWSLDTEIIDEKKENKILYSTIFNGKSAYFKESTCSVLNLLQNMYNNYGRFKSENDENENKITDIIHNDLHINEESKNNTNDINEDNKKEFKSKQKSSQIFDFFLNKSNNEIKICETSKITNSPQQNCINNILELNFPIDNTNFNSNIIDTNLGIKDNLYNIFFIEFDLKNDKDRVEKINNDELKKKDEEENKSKENIAFTEINNDIVNKDINFTLNGKLHGKKIFKKDMKFTVEYRKFIKSIQFRMLNFTKLKREDNNDNKVLLLFSKVLTNANIGIEFIISNYSNDNFQTNFNSIVNMGIKLNRLFIELTIPKMYFNIGLYENMIKKEKIQATENLNNNNNKENPFHSPNVTPSQTPNNSKYSSPKKNYGFSPNSYSNTYANSYTFNSPNDFQHMFNKQSYIRNNIKINNNYNSCYNSPIRYKPYYSPIGNNGMYSIMKFNYFPYNNYYQGVMMSPRLTMSPLSSNSDSTLNYHNMENSNLNQRKVSENFSAKANKIMGGNPLSNYDKISNPLDNAENPVSIKDKILNKIRSNKNKNMNNNNENVDSEKIDEEIKNLYMKIIKEDNNFDVFAKNVKRMFKYNYNNKEDSTIYDIFSYFKLISLFGLRVIYFLNDNLIRVNYTLSLNNFYIKAKSKGKTKELLDEHLKKEINEKLINIESDDEYIRINYNEIIPFHLRPVISELIHNIELIKFVQINDILLKESYFSILFFPKTVSNHFSKSSFLVYFSFKLEIISILPIKFNENAFINKNEKYNDLIEENIEKIKILQKLSSYDYDFFMKWYDKRLFQGSLSM